MIRPPPNSKRNGTLFPYTTLCRSERRVAADPRPIAASVHRTRPKSSICSVGTAVSKDAGLMPDARGTSRRPPHPVPEVSMPLTDSTARAGAREQVQAAAHRGSCPQRDKPWVLVAAILGSSLASIEGSVVNLALPAIQSDFSTTFSGWHTCRSEEHTSELQSLLRNSYA